MKIKTQELADLALDWAAAKCEGLLDKWGVCAPVGFKPSTDWSQGGPIIGRERMKVEFLRWDSVDGALPVWLATRVERHSVCEAEGFSPLIAAMRCFVAGRLGDEVDIPEGLV